MNIDSADDATPIKLPDCKPLELSKNAWKRMKKAEKWIAERDVRKQRFKEADKARRAKRVELGLPASAKRSICRNQTDSGITTVIDCSFDHLMTEKERKSLASQLGYSYSANRFHEKRLSLVATSVTNGFRECLRITNCGYTKWTSMMFCEEDFLSLYGPSKLVYLSADSPNVLSELSSDEVYVVGGIVDRNRYKGLCLNKATELGTRHARLPVPENLMATMKSVLTVNHGECKLIKNSSN